MDDHDALKELIDLRIGSLERMVTREFSYVKEAMDRVADQSAPVEAVQSLLKRVDRLERDAERHGGQLNTNSHKIRVLWWVGSVITGAVVATATAVLQRYFGG